MSMRVVPIETRRGPFINYCYLLVDEVSGEAALIDPSWDQAKIVSTIKAQEVDLRYVLITHSHFDHINLAGRFVQDYCATLVLSKAEHAWSGFGGPDGRYIDDGEIVRLGQDAITCLVTPGHTIGSTCFQWGRNLFTGDTLFPDGCGICESNDAASQLFTSIRRLLKVVDPATRIFSGHSFNVPNGITLERAMKTNIYLQIESREAFCAFRMRRGQKNLFTFSSLACER